MHARVWGQILWNYWGFFHETTKTKCKAQKTWSHQIRSGGIRSDQITSYQCLETNCLELFGDLLWHNKSISQPHNQIRSDQIRSDQIRSDQIRSDQIRTDQTRSDQARPGYSIFSQIWSDQIRSDQIKSDQISAGGKCNHVFGDKALRHPTVGVQQILRRF